MSRFSAPPGGCRCEGHGEGQRDGGRGGKHNSNSRFAGVGPNAARVKAITGKEGGVGNAAGAPPRIDPDERDRMKALLGVAAGEMDSAATPVAANCFSSMYRSSRL